MDDVSCTLGEVMSKSDNEFRDPGLPCGQEEDLPLDGTSLTELKQTGCYGTDGETLHTFLQTFSTNPRGAQRSFSPTTTQDILIIVQFLSRYDVI